MNKTLSNFDQAKFYFIYISQVLAKRKNNILNSLEWYYKNNLSKNLKNKNIKFTLKHIDIIENPSPEIFQNYYRQMKPVVLRGAFNDWPAMKKWSPEFFKKEYGDKRLNVIRYNMELKKHGIFSVTMKEFVNSFNKGRNINYLRFDDIFNKIPELKEDIKLSSIKNYAGANERIWMKMFFGPKNTKTDMHMAIFNNLFVQIYGEKRWTIFSPEKSPLIYVDYVIPVGAPYFSSPYQFKENKVDENYPLTRYMQGYDILLKPGDVLYIPPFHWHWVESKTPSISLSSWWYDHKQANKSSKFFTFLCRKVMENLFTDKYNLDNFQSDIDEAIKGVVHNSMEYSEDLK